jgi:HK97 gp10 family phage protein
MKAVKETTEAITETARQNLVAQGSVRSTELLDSLEARYGGFIASQTFAAMARQQGVAGVTGRTGKSGQRVRNAYGIWAAWYYFFVEFGTAHSAAKPFLIPAVEAHRETIDRLARGELDKLVR